MEAMRYLLVLLHLLSNMIIQIGSSFSSCVHGITHFACLHILVLECRSGAPSVDKWATKYASIGGSKANTGESIMQYLICILTDMRGHIDNKIWWTHARTHARASCSICVCWRDATVLRMLCSYVSINRNAVRHIRLLACHFFFYSDVRARCWMMQNAISSRLTHVSHKIKLYYILSNMWGTHNINDGSWVSSALLRHILHRKNMIYNRIEKTWKLRTIDVHRMFMLNNKTLWMSSLCVLISLFISNNSLWMFMVPN